MITAEFEAGFVGHLDLTMPVRMGWHEGFQVYAEGGTVIGRTDNPWYFRSSEVECFSVKDGAARKVHGADAHFYKVQLRRIRRLDPAWSTAAWCDSRGRYACPARTDRGIESVSHGRARRVGRHQRGGNPMKMGVFAKN